MKKLTFTLLTILASLCSIAQTTYYSSGLGTGEWNNPRSWTLENAESGPVGPPTAQDHVVIRHTITHFAEDGYTHHGNVSIERHGSYEIVSGFDPSSLYIFAGKEFNIEGSLITTADFQHQVTESEGTGTLVFGRTALVYIGDDLILEANGGIIAHHTACGAGKSLNDVQFRGPGSYICGNGSFIVGERLRVWDAAGNEIEAAAQVENEIPSRVCTGFSFYASSDDCVAQKEMIAGALDLSPGFALMDFRAELRQTKSNLSWLTNDERFYDFFTVEKSQDGHLFEVAGTVDAKGQVVGTAEYALTDDAPYPGVTYYRLKQTMLNGNFAYSDIVMVENRVIGGELRLFPNPSTGNMVNLKAGNFLPKENLTISVRNMLGQPILIQDTRSNPAGELDYRLRHNLNIGTYVLVVSGKQQRVSHMFQIQ